MFFKDTPTNSLLDLRAHFMRLAGTGEVTPAQSRNLLIALELVDDELCSRSIEPGDISEATPMFENELRKAG